MSYSFIQPEGDNENMPECSEMDAYFDQLFRVAPVPNAELSNEQTAFQAMEDASHYPNFYNLNEGGNASQPPPPPQLIQQQAVPITLPVDYPLGISQGYGQPEYSLPNSPNFLGFEPSTLNIHALGEFNILPQSKYKSKSKQEFRESIEFSVSGQPGIPLLRALNKKYTNLDKRDELFQTHGNAVSARLAVVGYKPYGKQFKIHNWKRERSQIPIEKLTTEIAKFIQGFIEKHKDVELLPEHRDNQVGPGHIDMDRLVLLSFSRVSKSSWMPVLGVLPPVQAPDYQSATSSSNSHS